jgi:hypothetical protein
MVVGQAVSADDLAAVVDAVCPRLEAGGNVDLAKRVRLGQGGKEE